MIIIINLIYIAQFDTNGILTALYIVITYIQMQYVRVCTYAKQSYKYTYKFDRVTIAFILALFYWMKPLTDGGGEEAGVLGETPGRRFNFSLPCKPMPDAVHARTLIQGRASPYLVKLVCQRSHGSQWMLSEQTEGRRRLVVWLFSDHGNVNEIPPL